MADLIPNTSIPLGISVPQPANPLGTVEQFAQTQNYLNNARLFNQTFAARQRAGEIIAASDPDDPDGLTRALMGDEKVGSMTPQIITAMSAARNSLLDAQGKELAQSQSVLQSVIKGLSASYGNPSQLAPSIEMQLKTLPKGALALPSTRAALDSLVHGLTDEPVKVQNGSEGAPGDPVAAARLFDRNIMSWMIPGGVTPEGIQAFTGRPEMVQQGGQIQPGLGVSPITGAGFRPAGAPLPITQAPGFAKPGEVPVGGTLGPLGAAGGGGLAAPVPPSPTPSAVAAQPVVAGDGKPLISSGARLTPSQGFVGGLSPAQISQSEGMQKEFNETGLKSYNNAVMAQGTLQEMNAAFDNLQRGGGFTVPGSMGEERANLSKLLNTGASILGAEPIVDPGKVGTAEDLLKGTRRLGLMVTNEFLGQSREAAQTINNITNSVPNIQNSYIGGKLITNMLGAVTQRQIDYRNAATQFMSQNRGYLGPEFVSQFNSEHPMEGYVDQAFQSFGSQMKSALSEGLIKESEARSALRTVLSARQSAQQPPGGAQ